MNTKEMSPEEMVELAEISLGLERQCLVSWGLQRIVGGFACADVVEITDEWIYFIVKSGIQSDVQNTRDEQEMHLSRSDFNRYVKKEISLAHVVNCID